MRTNFAPRINRGRFLRIRARDPSSTRARDFGLVDGSCAAGKSAPRRLTIERRMAQLAAIDQQRESLAENGRPVPAGAVSPTSEEDAIFIQYNARYQALAEE